MPLNKETVFQNLYTQLSASVSGVLTSGRRLKHYDNVPPQDQPAFFVDQVSVAGSGDIGRPSRQVIKADVYIYTYKDDADGPAVSLNGLVGQVEAALVRQASDPLGVNAGSTTLSGTVASARVVSVEYGLGETGAQGIAIVGIEMIAGS